MSAWEYTAAWGREAWNNRRPSPGLVAFPAECIAVQKGRRALRSDDIVFLGSLGVFRIVAVEREVDVTAKRRASFAM